MARRTRSILSGYWINSTYGRDGEENEEELLAVDGCAVSDDCPGAFSDQSDDDDGLPAMVFADGTGGLVVGSRNKSPARRKRQPNLGRTSRRPSRATALRLETSRPTRRARSTEINQCVGCGGWAWRTTDSKRTRRKILISTGSARSGSS